MVYIKVLLYSVVCVCVYGGIQESPPTITIDPHGAADEGVGVLEGNIEVVTESDVLVLTRDNFKHVLSKHQVVLVHFYAPQCGQCEKLAPEFSKAATELKTEERRGGQLGKVDVSKEPQLAKEYLVSVYPTVKLFIHAKPVLLYDGVWTKQGLVDFMRTHSDPNYTPDASSVLELTDTNFTSTIQSRTLILVDFYAPWCKHCQALDPEIEGAAKILTSEGISIAKLDATIHTHTAELYNIQGYPTLMVFRNGRQFEYQGKRDKAGILSYMRRQAVLPSQEIKSLKEFQNAASKSEANVVGFFSDKNDDMFGEFINACEELRDKLGFFHTFNSTIGNQLQLKVNSLTLLMPKIYHSIYEDNKFIYTKTTGTYQQMASWVSQRSIPLVGERTKNNKAFKYNNNNNNNNNRFLVVVYFDVNFSHPFIKDTQYIRHKVLPVADKYRDVTFALCDEDRFADELERVGLDDSGENVNVGAYYRTLKYAMEPSDEFSSDILEEFVKNLKDGKIKPHIKSQPKPKNQQTGFIKILVGSTLESEIQESQSDILIQFHSSRHGTEHTHTRTFQTLARQLSKTHGDALTVAKFDASENDYPAEKFDVRKSPTFYFLRSREKDNPVLYTGNGSLESLKDFVKQESSVIETEDFYLSERMREEL
ncbi:hypothetical protein Pmani_008127 [Petrolisthes manimaculis]|uniref:Thioredoxin domain-containing protein n=1 Tax=Petrolisthes manimaculis TaxID=1843537 RepID=A0AAE1UJY1_9EUCA|nr:hypothetical protein Pmani_008127 [Petrolisthes manimaculis]